jgi:hypothetical protein
MIQHEEVVSFYRNIPVRYQVDIMVVGGGPAGIAAAVSAAKQGKSVYLAEEQGCLGGMGTVGLIPAFMQFSDGINLLAGGIGREIYEKLGGVIGENSNLSIKVEVLKRVYDELLIQAGVEFAFYTRLIGLEKEEKQMKFVVLSGKSGLFAVKAGVFIDCTGDGDLSAMAGAMFEKGDESGHMMAGTLCSLWGNINWDEVKQPDDRRLEEAFQDNVFTVKDRHLPGMWRVGKKIGGGNIGHTFGVDGTDERSITLALVNGRKLLLEYEQYYKKYLEGFEEMELVSTASVLGIRETRRIQGDYVLCLDDFINKAVFDDEIGRYAYPVDIHAGKSDNASYEDYKKKFSSLRYSDGESYGIPYRILTPEGIDNILVAGRCVSSDRFIQSSIRVMPGCFITGQAAGLAAALAVENKTGTRGVNVSELQERLINMGAYLPNCKKDGTNRKCGDINS